MTKRQHIQEQRTKPMGHEGLEQCRRIVQEHTALQINEVFVDAFSASILVQVYDALNETNKKKMLSFPIGMACNVAFKLSAKVS